MQLHLLYTEVIPRSGCLTTELKTKTKVLRKVKNKRKPCFNRIKSRKGNNTINLRYYLDLPSGMVEPFSNAPCFPKVGMLLERFFTRMVPEVGTLFSFFSLRKEV